MFSKKLMHLKKKRSKKLLNAITFHLCIHQQYKIAHMWNQLPAITKSSTTLAQFRSRLNGVEFAGCQCMNCIF